jgi:uncharacterized caspase-like protein
MSSANVRRWFAFAALCVVCTGLSQSASAADGKKMALLVGVDKYAEGSGFRPLPYTERDVEQLAAILIKSGYRPEDVRVLTIKRGNEDTRFFPSFRNIRREFDLLAKGRKPADSLLVALSGHGVKRNDKGSTPGAFFCPLDADITDPATLISLASLYDMLKDSRAGVKVMLVDACQNDPTEGKSGAIPFSPPPPPPSVAALFACSDGEVAWDARDLGGGHGVFFHFVIEGLKGQADADHNNQVTLAELAAYTEEKVPDYVSRMKSKRQTPYLQSSGGKIALLDIPRTAKPAAIVMENTEKAEAGAARALTKAAARPIVFDGVEYKVKVSSLEGDEWTLILTATSLKMDHMVHFRGGRAIMKGGRTFEIKTPMGVGAPSTVSLPKDVEIEIPLKMGTLPDDVRQFTMIEFSPPPGGFGPGRFSNVHPVVFRNVNVGDGTTGPDVAAEDNKDGAKEEKEPAKTASLAKVIYEGVDFKVKESTVEGNEWTMIVSATSLKVPHSIQFNRARAITKAGKSFEVRNPMNAVRGVSLPKGVEVEIPLKMGTLPDDVTRFTLVELYLPGRNNLRPVVFRNVRVDRP